MENIDSSQIITEALGNGSRACSGPTGAQPESASRPDQNHHGGSKVSEGAYHDDPRASAETGGSGDKMLAARDDAESNLASDVQGSSSRTPAYSSYTEYIHQLQKKRPQYDDLLTCLTYEGRKFGAFQILLADSGKDGVKSTILASDLSKLRFDSNDAVKQTLSDEVVKKIQTPPKGDVEVRIIILELALRQQSSSRATVEAIGSTYDVDPAFLNAFYCYNRNSLDFRQPHSPRSLFCKSRSFIRLHGCFVGLVMDKLRPSGGPLKIVLILSWIYRWDSEVQGFAFDGPTSIYSPIQEPRAQHFKYVGEEGYVYGWYCQSYAGWLSELDQDQLIFAVLHPYQFIYPWIEYRIYDIAVDTRRLRRKLNDIMQQKHFFNLGTVGFPENKFNDDHLFFHARILKDFVQASLELRRMLPRVSNSNDTRSCGRIQEIQGLISDTEEDAGYVLKTILELQQTAIGTMAIQESRRSINEAVSVKRLTQLAFVFIPLSYASSLFGMNINEMTGNGTKLWIFLITSLALLVGAMCFWRLSAKGQRVWEAHMEGRESQNISFMRQIMIIHASIRTENFAWMIREGILLGLVTNNVFGNKGARGEVWHRFYRDWMLRGRDKRRERTEESSV